MKNRTLVTSEEGSAAAPDSLALSQLSTTQYKNIYFIKQNKGTKLVKFQRVSVSIKININLMF